jgi:hypothetical protein
MLLIVTLQSVAFNVSIIGRSVIQQEGIMLLRTARRLLLISLLIFAQSVFALSTDPQLLQLVPPQSRLVAGMSSSAAQGTTGSFLLITHENRTDLDDFYALTGGDASRRLQSLLFVTAAGGGTGANEHSLLVSGEFNRDSIFRSGVAGVTRETYRGVPVLVVPPFEREREAFHEIRWLAVVDARIAIFGSLGSVQRELDRWIERSVPNPMLIGSLQRIKGHDDSWCVLLANDREHVAETVLGKLDPKLGEVAHDAGLLGFGMRFGRKIEIAVATEPFPARNWNAPNDLPGAQSSVAMHFISASPGEGTGSRAVVKVSRQRYEEWISEFEHRDPLPAGEAGK